MKQFFRNLPWKLARLEFYKKKPFAVACTVIFSVLLAFDLSIAVFVPSTNSLTRVQGLNTSDFGEFMDSTEFGDMSDMKGSYPDADSDSDSGSDSSSGSDSDSSSDGMPGSGMQGAMGDMPDDFDASEMGDMPSGGFSGETGDMPSGDASGDMSGFPGSSSDGSDTDGSSGSDTDGSSGSDTDGSSGSDTDGSSDSDSDAASDSTSNSGKSSVRGSGILGFLQGVKSHWVLLAVIFGILDALSITRLVILARRAKKERIEEAKLAREQMLAGEIVRTAGPAKKYKKTNPAAVWAIPMVGVLLLVVIVNALSAQSSVTVESTSATVYSGSAETTSLDTVLSGAGTLEEEDAESMELNSSVEVSTWYVSNGDTVEEGDTLAAVDKVSVMSAIASLQEQLDELDALLEEYESEEIDDTITAASDGRVMAIYAEEDTSVIDTMYDNGSLMILSIDGYLAVDVETDENLQAGDSVVVILSDDTELTGKVGSYVNGTAVILVSDEDASLSEEVSVETEDGEEIGSGSLYIHSELAVTGFLGTVEEISVEVGDEVESGDTLLTLTDTEYTGTYETLLAQRSELAEEMQELFTLYQDPYLYASCAGVVSGISDDSSSDSSSDDDSSDDDSSASAAEDDEVLAEAQSSDAAVAVSTSVDSGALETTMTAAAGESTAASDAATTATASAVTSETTAVTATATVCTVTSGTATATASTLTSSSDTTYTAAATSTSDGYDNYIGIVQSADADSATAEVLFLTGVYQISDYSDLSDYDLSADSMTEEYTIAMSEGIIMFTYSSSNLTVESAADIAAGDILVISYESGGSPGLGFTPIWIVRVAEDTSEDDSSEESGSTESDSAADSSASGSDTASGSSGSSSGSDSSSGSSGSSSGNSGSASGSDSSSGSTGSASGSDSSSGSASGSFGSSGSDSASGSSGSASSSDAASGNSDFGVLEGSTDSDSSAGLDFGSSDSQNSTESGTAGDSITGSTESSESSGSGDTTFTIDGTSSSTDLGITSSDSSGSSEDSDLSGDSSTYSSDASDISDSVSDSSGTTDITDASASGTSEESSVTNAYTVSKTTLAEITPQDTMTITITIDELDILSLEEGQTAQVTLDAFPGQSFEGEVTAIDLSGTNSGGSTKFTAEVTITREDDMLAGMNASAVITIDTTEDVLCIPENALVETDGVCYVYTTYDEKNDELGGLVEVTTGLSDGESVEILSGLSEGDSYYYSILDVVNYSTFSASSGSSSFSMESLFSSGGGGRGGM